MSEVTMQDRENSVASDVIMSDPADAESPTTDPSTYTDAQQMLELTPSQEQTGDQLPKSVAKSPLFKLPKEIRLRIYSYCLTSRYSVMWPTDRLGLDLQPKLLLMCSAVYEEAVDLLYSNMLHFAHPSDANMFLWVHNPELCRTISKIVFTIRDREVPVIWSNYLSSTKPERSLLNDYPSLRVLHIQFRSTFMNIASANISRRFEGWENEHHLREMLLGLTDRVPIGCDVKVLVSCRVLADDARGLYQSYPGELEKIKEAGSDGRVIYRTPWKQAFNHAEVALEIEGQEAQRMFGP